MHIDMQETQHLLVLAPPYYANEPVDQRFRRIKAFAERVGIRYCVAYSRYEKLRKSLLGEAGNTFQRRSSTR